MSSRVLVAGGPSIRRTGDSGCRRLKSAVSSRHTPVPSGSISKDNPAIVPVGGGFRLYAKSRPSVVQAKIRPAVLIKDMDVGRVNLQEHIIRIWPPRRD